MSKPKIILYLIIMLSICGSSAFAYSPQYADDEGKISLRWQYKQIPIAVSESLIKKSNNIKTDNDVLETIRRSLKHWEEVANIQFKLTISKENSVSSKGSAGDGISLITIAQTTENLLLFGEKTEEISAITRLFYTSKGDIKEADIVLNPILLFSTDGTFRSFDLEATLTHEIGHLIGLGHSNIFGSTMHSHQGKNGIYNVAGFSSRTLSEDDKAGAVSLYGKRSTNKNCCGAVKGNISTTDLSENNQLQIWLEESETARVFAGTVADSGGDFLIEGLPKAIYKIYVQDINGSLSTQYLGELDLSSGQIITFDKKISLGKNNFTTRYIGFNGQLANLAIPVSAGGTYTVYIGGENLAVDDTNIEFQSDNFLVDINSLLKHNYGDGVSVISFEVQVNEQTPVGDYSFYIIRADKSSKHIVGGLTVE